METDASGRSGRSSPSGHRHAGQANGHQDHRGLRGAGGRHHAGGGQHPAVRPAARRRLVRAGRDARLARLGPARGPGPRSPSASRSTPRITGPPRRARSPAWRRSCTAAARMATYEIVITDEQGRRVVHRAAQLPAPGRRSRPAARRRRRPPTGRPPAGGRDRRRSPRRSLASRERRRSRRPRYPGNAGSRRPLVSRERLPWALCVLNFVTDLPYIPASECPCFAPRARASLPWCARARSDRVENVPARGRPTWHQRFSGLFAAVRFTRAAAHAAGPGLNGGSASGPARLRHGYGPTHDALLRAAGVSLRLAPGPDRSGRCGSLTRCRNGRPRYRATDPVAGRSTRCGLSRCGSLALPGGLARGGSRGTALTGLAAVQQFRCHGAHGHPPVHRGLLDPAERLGFGDPALGLQQALGAIEQLPHLQPVPQGTDFGLKSGDLLEPARGDLDGGDEICLSERLDQIGHRACVPGPLDKLALGERGQDHDRGQVVAPRSARRRRSRRVPAS